MRSGGIVAGLAALVLAVLLGAHAWLAPAPSGRAELPATSEETTEATSDAMRDRAESPSLPTAKGEALGAPERGAVEPLAAPAPRASDELLVGVVRDQATRAPLPGALVALLGDSERVVVTGADGRFKLALDDRTWEALVPLVAWHPDYAAQRLTAQRPPEAPLEIALQRGVPVELTVVDRDTGAALPGAVLRTRSVGPAIARADAQGRLVLRVVPGEVETRSVTRDGFAELAWRWDGTGAAEGMRARLPLRRLAHIDARVVDEQGRAVDDAALELRRPAGMRLPLSAHLLDDCDLPGEAGDAEPVERERAGTPVRHLPVLPWDGDYLVTARADGHVAVTSPPLRLARAGDRAQVELVLVRAGSIAGRALRHGEPIGNAALRVLDADGEGRGTTHTTPGGRYQLDGLPPGAFTVVLTDGATGERFERDARVVAGRTVVCSFDVTTARSTVEGRVLWSTGEPVPGAWMSAQASGTSVRTETTRSDTAGRFAFDLDGTGPFDVQATSTVSVEKKGVPGGTHDLELVLPRLGTLRLLLLDASTGAPIESLASGCCRLVWRVPDVPPLDRELQRGPDEQGVVTLHVPAGRGTLRLDPSACGFVPLELADVEVLAGEGGPPLPIVLRRGASVTLRFVDARTGRPALPPQHTFWALPAADAGRVRVGVPRRGGPSVEVDDPELMRWQLDSGGLPTFPIIGLEPGTLVLRAFPEDVELVPAEVELPRDAGRTIDVAWSAREP